MQNIQQSSRVSLTDPTEEMLRAAQNDNADLMLSAADKGADLNKQDKKGNTALIYMAAYGNVAGVKGLVAKGAKLDILNNDDRTAAHKAVLAGHQYVFEYLIKHHANPNIPDLNGNTVVHHTAAMAWVSSLIVCIDHGGDPARENKSNKNAADLAANNNHYSSFQAIANAGTLPINGAKSIHEWLERKKILALAPKLKS